MGCFDLGDQPPHHPYIRSPQQRRNTGNVEASLVHPPSRRSRWLRIRLNAVASCTTVSHCQCASVVWAFPACDWTKLGVLPPASFRDRGAHCQQWCQQERRNGGTADALEAVRQPPTILLAGLMRVWCVCHAEVFSRLFFSKFRPSSLICAVAYPKSPSQPGRMESIKHRPEPVSRTGFIAVRSLGALQQRFTAGCRMRQAWMSFLQDQGARSPQCADCAQDPAGSSPLRDVLGTRGRPKDGGISEPPRPFRCGMAMIVLANSGVLDATAQRRRRLPSSHDFVLAR